MATVIFHCKLFKVDNTGPVVRNRKAQFACSQKIKIEKKSKIWTLFCD